MRKLLTLVLPLTVAATVSACAATVPPPVPPVSTPLPDLPSREASAAASPPIAITRLAPPPAPVEDAATKETHLAYVAARQQAAKYAEAGELDKAAGALVAILPKLAAHPELRDEFWSHNALMMLREAEGDPAAALAEDDQATLCAARGTWDPKERPALAFQKDRWHRAYLTRMLAESRTGSDRQALIQYAEAALDEYRAKGGFPDSVAVLEAYFAALDGKRAAALAAAKKVDPAKDEDVEDLYLVVIGLEAGGDHAGAEAVRRAMRTPGSGLARSIMLRWLDKDQKGQGFTPLHAKQR